MGEKEDSLLIADGGYLIGMAGSSAGFHRTLPVKLRTRFQVRLSLHGRALFGFQAKG